MAIKLIKSEWCPETGFRKEFMIDTEEDVTNLPQCCVGSSAVVAATGNVYVVNASCQWVEFGGEA